MPRRCAPPRCPCVCQWGLCPVPPASLLSPRGEGAILVPPPIRPTLLSPGNKQGPVHSPHLAPHPPHHHLSPGSHGDHCTTFLFTNSCFSPLQPSPWGVSIFISLDSWRHLCAFVLRWSYEYLSKKCLYYIICQGIYSNKSFFYHMAKKKKELCTYIIAYICRNIDGINFQTSASALLGSRVHSEPGSLPFANISTQVSWATD